MKWSVYVGVASKYGYGSVSIFEMKLYIETLHYMVAPELEEYSSMSNSTL